MAMSARMIGGRVLLALFGVCLSLVVAEVALRVGSRFVGRESIRPWARTGKLRVLCLGDSNTYGVYLEPSQAYPAVFERQWNARGDDGAAQVEVFNLGYPGTNSSRLVKDFRRMLRTFHPDIVTVMVGANDLWTMPANTPESESGSEGLAAALWKASRVYQFLYLAWRGTQVRQLQVTPAPRVFEHGEGTARYGDEEFAFGWDMQPEGGLPGRQHAAELEKHLRILAEQAAEFGTRLVFLTYAADASFYSWANSNIRAVAAATGTPLIDIAAAFKAVCPAPAGSIVSKGAGADCPELLPDQHPTALGHERMASILVEQLIEPVE